MMIFESIIAYSAHGGREFFVTGEQYLRRGTLCSGPGTAVGVTVVRFCAKLVRPEALTVPELC